MPNFQAFDTRPHAVNLPAEFMTQNITFLELDDGAVVEMEIGAADGGSGDLEDYVAIFEDFRLRTFNCRQAVSKRHRE